jgi:hypothetical protein
MKKKKQKKTGLYYMSVIQSAQKDPGTLVSVISAISLGAQKKVGARSKR